MLASAQTFKFMGIPFGISIDEFTSRLEHKGATISKYDKGQIKGNKLFEGTFYGQQSYILLEYNTRDNNNFVWCATVTIESDYIEHLERIKNDIKNGIESKYINRIILTTVRNETDVYKIYESENSKYDDFYGSIGITIKTNNESTYSNIKKYQLDILYTDAYWFCKNEQINKDDL